MELNDYLQLPYTIMLRPDDEGDWIAYVDELKGCIAHGSTEVEALEQITIAKREWLEAAIQDGVPIPLPEEDDLPSGKFVCRLPRSMHRDLAIKARRDKTSINTEVVGAVASWLGADLAMSRLVQTFAHRAALFMPSMQIVTMTTFGGFGPTATPVGSGQVFYELAGMKR